MKSHPRGRPVARIRSARKTTAPLSTATRRGSFPAKSGARSCPRARTRAAISSCVMRTRPSLWPTSAPLGPAGDYWGHFQLGSDPLCHPFGLHLSGEAPNPDPVACGAVLRLGGRQGGVVALLRKLFDLL